MLLVLALFIVAAILAPIFGADSRDGLDWTPNHFLAAPPAPEAVQNER